MLHARQRTGRAASGRGAERFMVELTGCRRHNIRSSITVRQTKTVAAATAAIDQTAWADIHYPTATSPRWPRPPWAGR